ncbi:MAG: hypothetical protein J6W15_08280 [Clostridia bacterium]|nr:hypothetical protein [Clostridia bacterium]
MRNDDWINHTDDVPEEVLRQAAEKDFEEESLDISRKHGGYKWWMYKKFKHPVTTTIGVPLLCLIFLTVFFWPYIKEWAAELFEKIAAMF